MMKANAWSQNCDCQQKGKMFIQVERYIDGNKWVSHDERMILIDPPIEYSICPPLLGHLFIYSFILSFSLMGIMLHAGDKTKSKRDTTSARIEFTLLW